jgi:hypothetical protein
VAPFSAIINCKRNQIQWVQYTRVNFFYWAPSGLRPWQ